MERNILQYLFQGYLKLLKRTVHIEWEENQVKTIGQIFGFWHEDSFGMNLVLEQLASHVGKVNVIVTADRRGDYIQDMVESSGGKVIRVLDGKASYGALKKIQADFGAQDESIAVALDGPLGPRHEPKKLAFYFSERMQKEFTGFTLEYSSYIRLWWRWDEYVIPLPFSKVSVFVHNYGIVSKKQIPPLPVAGRARKCGLMGGEKVLYSGRNTEDVLPSFVKGMQGIETDSRRESWKQIIS